MFARVACPEHFHLREVTMERSIIGTRHRSRSGKDYLESLIDPIDGLSETIFSVLIFILYILAFRLIILASTPQGSISQENLNDLLSARWAPSWPGD